MRRVVALGLMWVGLSLVSSRAAEAQTLVYVPAGTTQAFGAIVVNNHGPGDAKVLDYGAVGIEVRVTMTTDIDVINSDPVRTAGIMVEASAATSRVTGYNTKTFIFADHVIFDLAGDRTSLHLDAGFIMGQSTTENGDIVFGPNAADCQLLVQGENNTVLLLGGASNNYTNITDPTRTSKYYDVNLSTGGPYNQLWYNGIQVY